MRNLGPLASKIGREKCFFNKKIKRKKKKTQKA